MLINLGPVLIKVRAVELNVRINTEQTLATDYVIARRYITPASLLISPPNFTPCRVGKALSTSSAFGFVGPAKQMGVYSILSQLREGLLVGASRV